MSSQTTPFRHDRADALASSPTCSTYWMPLDEPRQRWAAFGAQAQLVSLLTATAHAFFARSHETKALKQFSLAVEQEQHGLFAAHAGYWYGQAEAALGEATRHWSRAAYALDVLAASDGLGADGLDDVRAMSRAARAQQERLWKLTDEVRAALLAWRERQQAQPQREEARP